MPTINSKHYVHKYDKAIKAHDHEKVGSMLIKGLGKKISVKILGKLADKRNFKELKKAITLADHLHHMNNAASREALITTCFYAETKLKKQIEKNEHFDSKNNAKLPLRLEYDPDTKRTFIHTEKRLSAEGKQKEGIFVSYELDDKKSRVLANAVAHGKCNKEREGFKTFKDVPCVLQARAIISRNEHGKDKVSFLTDLYSPGALNEKVFRDLSHDQKLKVAKDILRGISEVHSRGYIHRDLKPANIFINKHGDAVHAVLGDLGQTQSVADVKGQRPNASPYYNPPEVYGDDLKTLDYQAAEMFSVGCVFYEMLYKKPPSWINAKYFPKGLFEMAKMAQNEKKVLKESCEKAVKVARKEIKHDVKHKWHKAKEKEFKELILGLLHHKPQKRPSAKEALAKI